MEITEAGLADANAIGQIQIQAWLDSYPNPDLDISEEDIKAKTEEWDKMGDQRIVDKLNEVGVNTWVAKENGKVVGFIGIKKEKDVTKIEALFVFPEYQKRGIGSKLMNKVLSLVGDLKKITIEVLYYNQTAIDFYESFGFVKQGKSDNPLILPSGKVITSILMTKTVKK